MVGFGSLVLTVAVGLCSPVQALTAREILDEAKRLDETTRNWTDRTRRMKLNIYDKRGGVRQRDLRVFDKRYPDDEDKAILFFLSPPEVKGTGFLQWAHKSRDDDQWLYLPELKRTRRITARIRDQSFMGTDFSYRDLEILGEIQDWTDKEAPSELVGEENIGAYGCHVIELHPKQEGMSYGRIVMWMDREKLVARKMDYYDEDGEQVKTLALTEIRDIGTIPTAHRMEMRNLKKGSRTVAELTEVAHNVGLSDELFSQRHLERGGP